MNEGKPNPKTGVDTGTQLVHERFDLAMDWNYLAGERTVTAWIRTSLSTIAFGFTIGSLRNILPEIEFKEILGNTRTVSIKAPTYSFVVLGNATLLVAALKHWRRARALNTMGLGQQFSVTFNEALLLAAVGRFALTSLVMQS